MMGRKRTKNLHLPPGMRVIGGRYYFQSTAGGKRRSMPLGRSYPEALAAWAALRGASGVGTTVAHALDGYAGDRRHGLLSKAERTQKDYAQYLGVLRENFEHMALRDVRPMHIAQFLDANPAPILANRQISCFSGVFKWAIRKGWCEHNPCLNVQKNTETERRRYLEDAELDQLRGAADDQWKAIIDFAYLTAVRRGDLIRMRLSDITPRGILLTPGKTRRRTGKRILFELTPALQEVVSRILKLQRKASAMTLFARRDGQPYTESGFDSIWQRLVKRSGVQDVHFHDVRSKSLTDAHRADGLDYAQALGGHANRDTTEGYIKAREVQKVRPLK